MLSDLSTATRAISRLESLGLAERSNNGDDRRVVLARATKLGSNTINRVIRRRALGMERLLESFDQQERELLADQLEGFVDSIDRLVAELSQETTERSRRRNA